jgi:hypothetical protein
MVKGASRAFLGVLLMLAERAQIPMPLRSLAAVPGGFSVWTVVLVLTLIAIIVVLGVLLVVIPPTPPAPYR